MLSRRPDEENGEQAAPVQERELEPYMDHAEPVLRKHGVDDDLAAEVWGIFHGSKTSAELSTKLQPLDIPNEVKHDLVLAKQKNDPAPGWESRLEKVVDAIKRITKMNLTPARDGKSVLKLRESHPNVMRALVDAELKDKESRQ
jgi:hypothetical protein